MNLRNMNNFNVYVCLYGVELAPGSHLEIGSTKQLDLNTISVKKKKIQSYILEIKLQDHLPIITHCQIKYILKMLKIVDFFNAGIFT